MPFLKPHNWWKQPSYRLWDMDDTDTGSTSLGSESNVFMAGFRWWNLDRPLSRYNIGLGVDSFRHF